MSSAIAKNLYSSACTKYEGFQHTPSVFREPRLENYNGQKYFAFILHLLVSLKCSVQTIEVLAYAQYFDFSCISRLSYLSIWGCVQNDFSLV